MTPEDVKAKLDESFGRAFTVVGEAPDIVYETPLSGGYGPKRKDELITSLLYLFSLQDKARAPDEAVSVVPNVEGWKLQLRHEELFDDDTHAANRLAAIQTAKSDIASILDEAERLSRPDRKIAKGSRGHSRG